MPSLPPHRLTPSAPCAITALSADALSRAIHARTLSCREVMQAYLDRIHQLNPGWLALVSLQDDATALAQADERDAQLARGESMGWMHGMPQAIKDLSNAAGLRTTLGSVAMKDFVAQDDGLLAQRMKAAGCIVIGKTNVPEFGLGSHTFNAVFGTTVNAYDPQRSAGGSSGGSAVALALRLLPVADGSDFMGSLRNPAGWNHVLGLRPAQGRVPMWPVQDVWTAQLGTEGPMARTATDLAHLLQIQAGPDPRTPLSIATEVDFIGTIDQFDPKTCPIGWLGDLQGHLALEDGILDTCEQALRRLEGLGCPVAPTTLGLDPERLWQTWLVWRQALVGPRVAPFTLQAKTREQLKPEALWEYEQSRQLTGAQFMAASAQRSALYHRLLALQKTYPVLALPVAQVWPFPAEQRWPQQIAGRTMDTYHRWMEVVTYATLAGLPALSLPAGFNAQGLPMGLQLIGPPQGEALLLQIARAYEQAHPEFMAQLPVAAG